ARDERAGHDSRAERVSIGSVGGIGRKRAVPLQGQRVRRRTEDVGRGSEAECIWHGTGGGSRVHGERAGIGGIARDRQESRKGPEKLRAFLHFRLCAWNEIE